MKNNTLQFSKIRLVAFDFDGVFTDNSVYVDQEGREMVRCHRSDGIGLAKLSNNGISSVVISTEKNAVVRIRCEKLKIPCYHGVSDKLSKLWQVMNKHRVESAETAFVGNDVNDLAVLNYVGFPIAVADSHPEVTAMAYWCTTRPGGYGAVREVCDEIVLAHQRSKKRGR